MAMGPPRFVQRINFPAQCSQPYTVASFTTGKTTTASVVEAVVDVVQSESHKPDTHYADTSINVVSRC
jgi:hypothetical protein